MILVIDASVIIKRLFQDPEREAETLPGIRHLRDWDG